jgi:hypothetical protein
MFLRVAATKAATLLYTPFLALTIRDLFCILDFGYLGLFRI